MEYKNKYPEAFDYKIGLLEEDVKGITNNESETKESESKQSLLTSYGACWWCSYTQASLGYTHWYDERGYYHYYNTCSCPYWIGCGSHGYVKNDYCTCGAPYPSMAVSSKTNNLGLTTVQGTCGACGYHWQFSY